MAKRLFAVMAVAFVALAGNTYAQGKASEKGKAKEPAQTASSEKGKAKKDANAAATEKEKKASPDASNKGGDTRGAERAAEAQKQGKGAEQRGFATPKGLTDAEKDKAKEQEKADKERKDKDKEKAKGRDDAPRKTAPAKKGKT